MAYPQEPELGVFGPWSVAAARPAALFDVDRAGVLADACVVVIDDLDSNVLLLDRVLRKAGASRVHGFTDPRMAIRSCLQLQPDLVLLDLHMPQIDGIEVLGQLRRQLPADEFLPVIVLTADMTSDARERALDAGAKDFLTKPFDRVEILQRVRNLLELRALYRELRRRNKELQDELDLTTDQRRQEELLHRERRARIESVLAGQSFRIIFQPIVDIGHARVVGLEALSRFDFVPAQTPDVWFAEAASVGLGSELELAAINAAFALLAELPDHLWMSVNASASTVAHPAFVDALAGKSAGRVVVELTEHDPIDDFSLVGAPLDEARRRGVRVAVDDTGAGYAGLRQILGLRPDIIKLDVDITRGIDSDPARRAMAASLVQFGRDTGAVIVAEGVETPSELDVLRQLDVPWGQGYHLGRPAPLATIGPDVSR